MASTAAGYGKITKGVVVATAASLATSAMLARTVVNDFLPYELHAFAVARFTGLCTRLFAEFTIVVAETSPEGHGRNEAFHDAMTYLGSMAHKSSRRLRVSTQSEVDNGGGNIAISLDHGEEVLDSFNGIEFRWRLLLCASTEHGGGFRGDDRINRSPSSSSMQSRSLELSFDKKHKETALERYLPHVLQRAKAIRESEKTLRIHMNHGHCWISANLRHPATFDTLAMEDDLKRSVMEDLARFVGRREYYARIGKAWKRGYLLYGPPGTGKSSLVAAMANFLKFDIYDIELTKVAGNSALRDLLMSTSNRSIFVVEDIDCSMELKNRADPAAGDHDWQPRRPQHLQQQFWNFGGDNLTLSGMLNCIDGLWSSCGEERIIVFTTNFKERIDPALLRPGRMDVHVYMGYCGTSAFRVLASKYHVGLAGEHPLFWEIEELLRRVKATPAEVAEELMRSDNADEALMGLASFLKGKKSKDAGDGDGGGGAISSNDCVDEEMVLDGKDEV